MINIKHAATTIAAVVVAGAAVKGYITRTRKSVNPIEEAIKNFYSPEFIAFNKAQDVSSDRMLSGFYDDVSDDQVRAEFAVIYANFLSK